MDENLAQTQPEPVVTKQPQQNRIQNKKKLFLIGGMLLLWLLLGISTSFLFGNKKESNSPKPDQVTQKQKDEVLLKDTPYGVVYGVKNEQNTTLSVLDIQTQKEKLLVTLPKAIKRVTLLSPTELLFIHETNTYDNGQELAVFDIDQKGIVTKIKASPGYVVDEYAISPNKRYLAIWEIAPVVATGVLSGGRSRVYGVDLQNPTVKNLIYDEQATENTPVHYPSAVTDTGKVFMDSYVPNVGTGWAYGVSVAMIDGTDKHELSTMKNGTYGTKLFPSPDGTSIVFGGYDGTKGPGDASPDGFRVATIYVNTIEFLETDTEQRIKKTGLPTGNIFTYLSWMFDGSRVVYATLSRTPGKSGVFLYDWETTQATRFSIPDSELFMTALPDGKYMSGKIKNDLGNLGYTYAAPFISMTLGKNGTKTNINLPPGNKSFQHIATIPSKYFQNVLGVSTKILALATPSTGKDRLQLEPYYPPTPTPTSYVTPIPTVPGTTVTITPPSPTPTEVIQQRRDRQQHRPPTEKKPDPEEKKPLPACRDLYAAQVNAVCGPKPSKPGAGATPDEQKKQYELISAWNQCLDGAIGSHYQDGTCAGSPLYLYGKAGTKVSVKIHAPIFNAMPAYTDGYEVVLENDGKMNVKGSLVRSIKFDYTAALRVYDRPTRGRFVKKDEVDDVLLGYAEKFKLTKKETEDLVAYGKSVVISPYVFISFFDQETSKALLPMTFAPQPDVYINIVFYFKEYMTPLSYSVQEPTFPKLPLRTGFTAVEISGMVE